jgi:hypothetical protein
VLWVLAIPLVALTAGCGAQRHSLPPMSRSVALTVADGTVSDWMGDHLNTQYWYSAPWPKCRRLTPSSYRCALLIFSPHGASYFEMAIRMGTAKDLDVQSVDGKYAPYLPYGEVTRAYQHYSKSGKVTLWLPAGTVAGRHSEPVRHFDVCPTIGIGHPPLTQEDCP